MSDKLSPFSEIFEDQRDSFKSETPDNKKEISGNLLS